MRFKNELMRWIIEGDQLHHLKMYLCRGIPMSEGLVDPMPQTRMNRRRPSYFQTVTRPSRELAKPLSPPSIPSSEVRRLRLFLPHIRHHSLWCRRFHDRDNTSSSDSSDCEAGSCVISTLADGSSSSDESSSSPESSLFDLFVSPSNAEDTFDAPEAWTLKKWYSDRRRLT